MYLLTEDKKSELIAKSKQGDNYAPQNQYKGKNRYERRTKSKLASSVKHFNAIDMNKFFKDDILDVNIDVKGETDIYLVRLSFSGTLDELHNFMSVSNKDIIDRKTIAKALARAFNNADVYINCTCPDFCLHPTTEIKLMNGDVDSIENLFNRFSSGEEMWVYSTDEKGDFKPGKVEDIWVSSYTNEFVKVTLDNNEEIITTPAHRFMLRDGSYAEAKDLTENQSLMPLYFSYHDGYENVKINSGPYPSKFKSVYKEVANTLLLDEIEEAKIRSGEDNIAIHHSDYNKLNNYPSNLKPMGVLEHWNWHSNHVKETGQIEKFLVSTIDDAITYYSLDDRYNHKVAKVEFITFDEDIPVYDIQVKDYNNFYVNAGVILHNCYRHKYWSTQHGTLIGEPEVRPADITNPKDSKGPACKHIILAMKDTSWLIRVASVIYNYINYMKDHRERDYQRTIYPAIYQEPYTSETQLDIYDVVEPETEEQIDVDEYQGLVNQDIEQYGYITDTTLDLIDDMGYTLERTNHGYIVRRDSNSIGQANKYAREKTRFKPGNEYRFKSKPKNDDRQLRLDFDSLEQELV